MFYIFVAAAFAQFSEAQTTCGQGQYVDNGGECKNCTDYGGTYYQDEIDHQLMSCKDQPLCDAGKRYAATPIATAEATCESCPQDTYREHGAVPVACTHQPPCDQGQKITGLDNKTARASCAMCETDNTEYQDESNHRQAACKTTTMCGPGERFMIGGIYADATCESCDSERYVELDNHRQRSCSVQVHECGPGKRSNGNTTTNSTGCVECEAGKYKVGTDTKVACQDHRVCDESQTSSGTAIADVTCMCVAGQMRTGGRCVQCPADTFNEYNLHTYQTCPPQTTCTIGEMLVNASITKGGLCGGCPTGEYQDVVVHRNANCTAQITCNAGEKLVGSPTKTAPLDCVPCPDGTHQNNPNEMQCLPQTHTCSPGKRGNGDTKTQSTGCLACPDGTYQDNDHSFTACKAQPVCTAGHTIRGAHATTQGTCRATNGPGGSSSMYIVIVVGVLLFLAVVAAAVYTNTTLRPTSETDKLMRM